MLRPTIVAVCLSLFVPSAVNPGQTTATVNGTVQDVGGGAMPGVTVSVTNAATGLTRTNVTAAEGRFVVAGLPPGDYELRAEISGFKPLQRAL